MKRHTRRGEAQVEYAIIGIVVSCCAVTTMLVTSAGGLRRVAKASELCIVEAGDCTTVNTGEVEPGDGTTTEAQVGDGEAVVGEDGEVVDTSKFGPRKDLLNPDGTVKDGSDPESDELTQFGPLVLPPPPPPADPFGLRSAFGSFLNTGYGQSLYSGFKGLFNFFF